MGYFGLLSIASKTESDVQELTAREQEMVARIQKEQEDNMSEMDKAKELLKMKTVKIQRAAPQEVSCIESLRILALFFYSKIDPSSMPWTSLHEILNIF